MNALSGFIFLLSLIANCYFFPVTEFEIDIKELEKSYKHCPINCQEAKESECQCLSFTLTMNCTTYQVIEHGLRKLNLVCNSSDKGTYNICRILERLKYLETPEKTLCGTQVSQNHILNYIKTVYQRSNST